MTELLFIFFFFFITFKILRREVGNLSFSNETEVSAWSNMDFDLSYSVRIISLYFRGKLEEFPVLRNAKLYQLQNAAC